MDKIRLQIRILNDRKTSCQIGEGEGTVLRQEILGWKYGLWRHLHTEARRLIRSMDVFLIARRSHHLHTSSNWNSRFVSVGLYDDLSKCEKVVDAEHMPVCS